MGDLGALIAPRPLLIETGDKDPLNGEWGLVNATEQVEITRRAYKLFDAEARLCHHIFAGGHRGTAKRLTHSLICGLEEV